MTVGASILTCCCDDAPSDPCVGVTWDQAPQELSVSGAISAQVWMRYWAFGTAYENRVQIAVQFDGIVQKGSQNGWNQGPNTNLLYSSFAIDYEWQVTQEVLDGPGSGDAETGSGSQAFFRIFCSKTGNGSFGLGPTPQALCDGEVVAEPPYVIGRFSMQPPLPPTTPNGPPIRPSFPWGGVQQSFPSPSSLFLNQMAGSGALSRFQPEVSAWVSTSGLTQGYQPVRLQTYLPSQSLGYGGVGDCGTIPTNYSRCEWARDFASLDPLCGWFAGIIDDQTLSVTVA